MFLTGTMIVALILTAFTSHSLGQDTEAMAVAAVVTKDRIVHLGTVTRENGGHIEIKDLFSDAKQIFEKSNTHSIRKNLSNQAIVDQLGGAKFIAWKILAAIPAKRSTGLVAETDEKTIYFNRGSNNGIRVGHQVNVYRREGEIVDPKSGKPIGHKRKLLAKLKIISVDDNVCEARINEPIDGVKTGDEAEFLAENFIGVLPFVEGELPTPESKEFTENFVTAVGQAGISLVERKLLDQVLQELSLQNSKAFDSDKIKKFGNQVGASAVLLGSLERNKNHSVVHARLVQTATGKIIFTTSFKSRELTQDSSANRAGMAALVTGRFDVVWTELPSRKRGSVVYDFLANGMVKKAGVKIGTWETKSGYALIKFLDSDRGTVTIKPQNRLRFTGTHNWKDGRKSTWVGKRQ